MAIVLCVHQTVHQTITNFPLRRCLIPAPMSVEPRITHQRYGAAVRSAREQLWKAPLALPPSNDPPIMDGDESNASGGESGASQASNDDVLHQRASDRLSGMSEAHVCTSDTDTSETADCYDPAFYLPVLYQVLQTRQCSVRRIIHAGLLSLALIALGSACDLVRACATAVLHHVHELLEDEVSHTLACDTQSATL